MVVSRARCRKATKKTFYCANNMNKYFTMVALALFGATAAQAADEVWTHGVNADGGWYDANKIAPYDGDADDLLLLCRLRVQPPCLEAE